MPTQKTKFVMSQAQPTGTFRPQIPIPSQKSQETATPRRPRSASEGRKKNHHASGVFPSTGPRHGLGDRVKIVPAQDEGGTARDRIVAVVLVGRRHVPP